MYSTEKISVSISCHWFAKFTKSVAQIKVSKSCKNVADLWSRQAVKIILIAKGVKKNAAYIYGSINDRVDGTFSTEMVDSSSIPIGSNQRLKNMLFTRFRLTCSTKYGTMRSLHHVRYRQVAA